MANKKEYFRTPVSDPKTIITPAGEKEENVIAMKLDEKGNEEFYISHKTNVYEAHQADLEESKIGVILRRVNETGDITILNMRKGTYLDTTMLPKNLVEANMNLRTASAAAAAETTPKTTPETTPETNPETTNKGE